MTGQAQVQYSDDGHWWWDGAAWRSVQTDPPPGMSAVAVTPAVIAVVHPERFVPANPAARHKFIAPVTGVPVERNDVAVLTIVLPLVALADAGLVAYDYSVSKKLMMTFHSLKARVLSADPTEGISGQLVARLRQRADVDLAVRKWLGNDHANPWNHCIGTAINEGVDLGLYIKRDTKGIPVASGFKGEFTLELAQDRVQAAASEVDRLALAFQRHRDANGELHEQLKKKVQAMIEQNAVRSSSDDL